VSAAPNDAPGNTSVIRKSASTAEGHRLAEDDARRANWKRWGPYLAERQWATVREDYSEWGTCWDYFPHDHARSRAYRWGEDGLLGFCDRECRLCFGLALWNGRDPILKERLYGLTGNEGNHAEDVKEEWFYLDSTPTHSYAKALYKYPQAEFPYGKLRDENHRRGREEREYELTDTGVFDGDRYFDIFAEYAKPGANDILIRITVANRGPEAATLHLLPTLWFRNTWSWGCPREGTVVKPLLRLTSEGRLRASHETLGDFIFEAGPAPDGTIPRVLFTENDTNTERLFGTPNPTPFVKDAFHEQVVNGHATATNPEDLGTKAAPWYRLTLAPYETQVIRLRLVAAGDLGRTRCDEAPAQPVARRRPVVSREEPSAVMRDPAAFDAVFTQRLAEADEFYRSKLPSQLTPAERNVVRQGYAGLLWSKQFYHYVVADWLDGDPATPKPPASRQGGRNAEWRHLYARDIISMPDKWEYPWFAAWDLAFHMIPFARIDGAFAKQQLGLFLREWYMHPNGQLPAYEFAFGDVNPPVHAWAAWRIYKLTGPHGGRDRDFLESIFQKLLINFTWWVNRKDAAGKNLFSGGFLGLDNIGVFDRSKPLPTGGSLQQADGTAWMAFYAATMLAMALELARDSATGKIHSAYEDMASKFLEHFVQIADAMNTLGGTGLWNEEDGFYYDQLDLGAGNVMPLRSRSMVGLLPLIAVEVLEEAEVDHLPGFKKRLAWFVKHRHDLNRGVALGRSGSRERLLLAIPTRDRLRRVLRYLGDEAEFLSPHGLRSVSKAHAKDPFIVRCGDEEYRVDYSPGESTTGLFGGNSNWRGPIWFPVNYLLIEALERYHHFYGPEFTVEYPTGSGRQRNLREIAADLEQRLGTLFLPDKNGRRPCHGDDARFATDPHWRDLVLFHEYFHGDTGRGLGANHQTGWTALVLRGLENVAKRRGSI
jgi:hypothetical protein